MALFACVVVTETDCAVEEVAALPTPADPRQTSVSCPKYRTEPLFATAVVSDPVVAAVADHP
jgi:hypothetical protein